VKLQVGRISALGVVQLANLYFAKDMTAFIATNSTESIGFIATEADKVLTNWAVNLSKKYISIPTEVYDLPGYVDTLFRDGLGFLTNIAMPARTTCPIHNLITRRLLPRREILLLVVASLVNMILTCTG
jgi:hypothetical protein